MPHVLQGGKSWGTRTNICTLSVTNSAHTAITTSFSKPSHQTRVSKWKATMRVWIIGTVTATTFACAC